MGPKYQVVIPREVRKVITVEPGQEVLVSPLDNYSIRIVLDPKNWVEASYGSAKGAWGKESDKYLRRLRESWQKRKL